MNTITINFNEMELEVFFFQDDQIIEIEKISDWQNNDVTKLFNRDSIRDIEDEVLRTIKL